MADLKIIPSKLKGSVKIPPSKSMAHRAIICAALSDGICRIDNIDYSDDIIATINAMNSLGATIEKYDDYMSVEYETFEFNLQSNGRFSEPMKFNVIDSKWGGYTIYDNSSELLIKLGDIYLNKQNTKTESFYNHIQFNFHYNNIKNAVLIKKDV